MTMKLTQFIQQDEKLTHFIGQLPKAKRSLITGINPGAFSVLILQLLNQLHQPILLVTESEHKAQDLYNALNGLVPPQSCHLFPVEAALAIQGATASPDELSERLSALTFLCAKRPGVVIATPQALQYKLSSPESFQQARRIFQVGGHADLKALNRWLEQMGYHKDHLVSRPGEFAIRGDIVDIYPLTQADPIRLEFFDDEIDTIKTFDVSSQRSLHALEQVTVTSSLDRVFLPEDNQQAAQKITAAIQKTAAHGQELAAHFETALETLKQGGIPDQYGFLIDFLLSQPAHLIDYLAPSGLVIYDDWTRIRANASQVEAANTAFIEEEIENGSLLPHSELRFSFESSFQQVPQSQLYLSLFQKGMGRLKLSALFNWTTRVPQQFFSQMPLIKNQLKSFAKADQTVILQADNDRRAKQMAQTFIDFGIDLPIVASDDLMAQRSQILVGAFNTGFVLPTINLIYLTERELFNAHHHKKRRIQTFENAQRLRNYTQLKPGDYVVHVNHGIGRFEGIKTLTVDGRKRDYITITYQHHAQLFVPAEQLSLVQKYAASEGHHPRINQLGSSEWHKTKRKVQAKVEDIADDLVALYAKRDAEKGFAFSHDNELQEAFERRFPYVETPDQLRSIQEIKADMERPHPMDRLIVGDVGFGKTEVALRAAFKAIQDGKQVAFLVPTTILAQQHYETMQDRFKDFPVNTAMLSRFQTDLQTKQILKKLAAGQIDLVVGTHRVLSKDVHFKDLGLLIIDEEQRFGVKHKEKLKQLKANIDVLTLTATPIPRTLHMSMVGVRDLSIMETPPANRFPIQTYVTEQLPSVVKTACLREMARNGQIFYLHNRVDDIEKVVMHLEELIPQARIAYIHGRMNENQLEEVLYRFLNNEFDILVTTTIIETGIDMPNVNTLIIENADHYGLSQLYQLRGRIGRSARLAYAYFLYQPNKVLTEVGEKRLEAIRDFTELGSGFKIAMRDLSIRGAGNMLGKQQHGFIDSVGYELYSQMLGDAIKKKRGQKALIKSHSEVDLSLEAYIPETYIQDQKQKIEFYKKIKAIADVSDSEKVADELIDRFGDYPAPVENLLAIGRLKAAADRAQVLTLTQNQRQLRLLFNNRATQNLQGPNIFKALSHVALKAKVALNVQKRLVVLLELPENLTPRQWFNELNTFLDAAGSIDQP